MNTWTLAINNLATVQNNLTETCPICGKAFEPAWKKRYCSIACRVVAYAPLKLARQKAVRTARPMAAPPLMMMPTVKLCGMCGDPLPKGRPKFCSDECVELSRQARKRAKRAEARCRQ